MISGSYSSQGGYYNHDGVNSYYSEGSSDNNESELNRALLHANEDGEAFVEVIRFSVKRGFDPFDGNEEGVDAYDIAANKGYTHTLHKLLTIESLKGTDSDTIGAAVMNFNKETQSIIKLLLEHEVIPNPMLAQKSLLIAGTRLANTPSYPQTAIHWLIEAASIISSKKDWDRGLYSHEEKTELHKSAIECVKMILNVEYSDVDPNALCKSPKPQTLLTYALMYGEIEIAKILGSRLANFKFPHDF